jgi:hypothetical protein
MRFALTALVFAGTALVAQPAKADPYPWCAVYGTNDGRESCYYMTFQQCLIQIQGLGGFCNQNPGYTGPPVSERSQRRRR